MAVIAAGSKRSSRERGDAHTCVQGAAVLRNGTWIQPLSQDQVSPLCCILRFWADIPTVTATAACCHPAPPLPHEPPMAFLGSLQQH